MASAAVVDAVKDINQVLVRKLEDIRLCKVQIYCLKVVIPLLTEAGCSECVPTTPPEPSEGKRFPPATNSHSPGSSFST